ncbi:hypothetical protein CORC01_08120 [Colletotrichum orchidophilum]|uniref:Uncharacterized protein n=1 Tax=Colletotrichum orchidophilum TaxID=1209926 RepID=A0A1G4B5G2_9PEZI|nr:uncharacterized protein CORC01_08120 [Colletotrichum orchidophilum]OHE96522.1 hypothetical protein CORC01_08120 [Colletotrichum orchidophilum]
MFFLSPPTGCQYITKTTYNMEVPRQPANWVKTDETQRWPSLWIGFQYNPYNGDVFNMNFVPPLLNWGPDNSISKGTRPAVFYSGNKCYGDGYGTIPAYNYTNISLAFKEPVKSFADVILYTNATHTERRTKDNGIKWTVNPITIAEDNLTE